MNNSYKEESTLGNIYSRVCAAYISSGERYPSESAKTICDQFLEYLKSKNVLVFENEESKS
jgi:hypothetical protein